MHLSFIHLFMQSLHSFIHFFHSFHSISLVLWYYIFNFSCIHPSIHAIISFIHFICRACRFATCGTTSSTFYSQAQSGKCLGRALLRCSENITASGQSSHAMCSAAPLNTHANACSVAPQGGLCSIAKASSDLAPQGGLCIKGGLCRNVNPELSSTHAS